MSYQFAGFFASPPSDARSPYRGTPYGETSPLRFSELECECRH